MEFAIDALLKTAKAAACGNGRLILDKCFSDYSGPTTLVLESYTADNDQPASFVIVRCNVPQATLRVAELPAEVKSVSLSQEHALLLPYRPERYEIYIAGRPVNPHAAYDALYDVIVQHASDWVRVENFLGERASAISVLSGGHGMLGKAPNPLASELRNSLLALGCRPSLLLEARESRSAGFDESQLKVLMLDPAATLLVSSISCRRTTNAAVVAELIRKHRGW